MRETIGGVVVDLSRFYSDLQPLVPLMRKWLDGDESEQLERVKAARTAELQALWEAPDGRWDAINDFMDELNEGPEPNEAEVLGRFVTVALEAGTELDRRLP